MELDNVKFWKNEYENAKEMLELADEGTELYDNANYKMYDAIEALEGLGIQV